MTEDPNAAAIAALSDNYCINRDPRTTAKVVGEVMAECARRLCEGHALDGNSFEEEVFWLTGNWNGPLTRQGLIETAACLIEQIALWREELS